MAAHVPRKKELSKNNNDNSNNSTKDSIPINYGKVEKNTAKVNVPNYKSYSNIQGQIQIQFHKVIISASEQIERLATRVFFYPKNIDKYNKITNDKKPKLVFIQIAKSVTERGKSPFVTQYLRPNNSIFYYKRYNMKFNIIMATKDYLIPFAAYENDGTFWAFDVLSKARRPYYITKLHRNPKSMYDKIPKSKIASDKIQSYIIMKDQPTIYLTTSQFYYSENSLPNSYERQMVEDVPELSYEFIREAFESQKNILNESRSVYFETYVVSIDQKTNKIKYISGIEWNWTYKKDEKLIVNVDYLPSFTENFAKCVKAWNEGALVNNIQRFKIESNDPILNCKNNSNTKTKLILESNIEEDEIIEMEKDENDEDEENEDEENKIIEIEENDKNRENTLDSL